MKKFVAPLQAIALLLLCSGMAWMVFVLASINPTPPTVKDLQARNTQDLSFVSMNSTAMALAKQMLANAVPSPTGPYFMPVMGRETATPNLSAVMTLKPVFTLPASATPTRYLIPPTATRGKQDRPQLTATQPQLTATHIVVPTRTLSPRATNTPTKTIPTTVVPPTTAPPTDEPMNTPLPGPTNTNEPPPTEPPSAPTNTPEPIVKSTEPPATQSTP